MRFCQNIPPLFLSFIFSKSQPFSLFLTYNLIGVSFQFRYVEHVSKVHQNISRNLLKNFSSKNEEETKLKMSLEYSEKNSKKFLWPLRTCSRYLKGLPNLDLYISKENRCRRTYQSDYMPRKMKKVEILTKSSSKWD